jgi:hypothetical protein
MIIAINGVQAWQTGSLTVWKFLLIQVIRCKMQVEPRNEMVAPMQVCKFILSIIKTINYINTLKFL